MLCAPWNSSEEIDCPKAYEGMCPQGRSFTTKVEMFYDDSLHPTYKLVKPDNFQFPGSPMNFSPTQFQESTVGPDTPNSPESDYFQELNQLLQSGYRERPANSDFLDPDLFFEKHTESPQSYDFQPEMTHQELPTNVPPFFNPICLSDFNMDLYMDFDSETKEDFRDIEIIQTPVKNIGKQKKKELLDSLELAVEKVCPSNVRLINLTETVLRGNKLSEHETSLLNVIEKCVVDAVFEKKRHNPNKNRDKGKKREEEKQKFFFKGLLKYTETKFFADLTKSKKTRRRKLDKNSYYEHYWGEVSNNHKIDISNFYHPGKKVNVSSTGNTTAQMTLAENRRLKSINATYIDLILTSEKFREEANYYLENVFIQEIRNSRCKKIGKMLEKLMVVGKQTITKKAKLSLEKRTEEVVETLQDYIILNTKSKLPWSDAELYEAKDFAQAMLERQSLFMSVKPF